MWKNVCEDEHGGGPPRTVTTPGNNKVHDIVLQDRRITIRDIVEETGFSYHSVHNILEKELGMKKIDCEMGALNVDAGSETTKNSTL